MITQGQQIAQFTIVRKIGSGGMGEVFLAEDTKLGRQVALKFLPPELTDEADRAARFRREASAAAKVTHSNVTAIYDIAEFTEEQTGSTVQYIVMEYVEGVTLKEHLAARESDIAEILRTAEKIAAGLSAAHRLNIVHRDIKAENIIVSAEGEPKILDFGLAKIVDETIESETVDPVSTDEDTISKELTEIGKIVGTVTYMSPEQARGERLDTRSDVFSFGALLYRMCTGEFPFSGPTQVSTIAKILEKQHEAPSGKNAAIPPELERIINKCLQKNVDDRYQDTRDLVVDLRDLRKKFDSGVSDSISGIGGAYGGSPTKKRFSGRQLTFLSIVAMVMLTVIILAWDNEEGVSPGSTEAVASEYSIAILDFDNKSNDEELDWLEDGFPDILLTDLTESQALNVLSRERILDQLRSDDVSAENADGTYSRQQMRQASKKLGASSLITGSFFKIGDKVRIDARMEQVIDGKALWSQKVVGEDLFSLVDSLTDKVAVALNISDMMPTNGDIAAATTFSPEAYKLYYEGMKKFQLELYEDARVDFHAALAIDSTFALPAMRIGMSYVFVNDRVEGARYLNQARDNMDKLPVRDRSRLDAYLDVFLTQEFAIGFAKLESFVSNYPDDKEARTLFGIVQNVANKDTASAFEQFRMVLDQDPAYQFALAQSISLLEQYDRNAEAIALVEQLLKYHPGSPEPYLQLVDLYDDIGEIDQSIAAAHTMIQKFPNHAAPLWELVHLFIKQRVFDSSRHYLELYIQDDTTDNLKWASYHGQRSSLAMWEGKFLEATEHLHRRLQATIRTKDNDRIESAYRSLASHFFRLDMQDSVVFYARATTRQEAQVFQEVSYPLIMIRMAYDDGVELRSHFDSLESVMRSQIPQGMWVVVEALKDIYYGFYELDTARAIHGYQTMNNDPRYRNSGNIIQAASLQIKVEQYAEAIELLAPLMGGELEQTDGYSAPLVRFLIARAYEGVGDNDKAISNYREVLKYWGDPDVETRHIRETRERLANLTS